MTLAELKRKITLGTRIKKVDCCGVGRQASTLGTIRTVDKVQKNAFTMAGSWLYWQKAPDYEIGPDWFAVYYSGQPHTRANLIGKYEIIT